MRPGALKRALVVAGCGVLTVTASACQSTEQESAKIASREQAAGAAVLKLGSPNRQLRISQATLVSGGGRMAVAVKLTSDAAHTQLEVPLLVNVTGAAGKVLYTNATPGLEASLQHIAVLRPHETAWWVDDQVLLTQRTTGVKVQAGTGKAARSNVAGISTTGVHVRQQAGVSVLSGKLVDRAAPGQVAVSAVALKGQRVVAAGRVVVEVRGRSNSPTPFQVFLVGNAAGARTEVSAMPAGRRPIGG
jgi:hypothetical protein